jgi:hypothetical protein
MIKTTTELIKTLRLEIHVSGEWQLVPLQGGDGRWSGQLEQISGAMEWRREPRIFSTGLTLADEGDGVWSYSLEVEAPVPTRLRLTLERPGIANPFHIVPGVIFGDNNLEHAGPGHFPNLTSLHPENVSCSPYWELRADRVSLPLSILCYDGGVAAVSIEPYTEQHGVPDGFIRNGVFAQLAHGEKADAVGVTFGYRNEPRTFSNKDAWFDSTEHRLCRGTVRGRIYVLAAENRLAVHRIMRAEYARFRECPTPKLGVAEGARALTTALIETNWSERDREFTNQNTRAPGVVPLEPWRSLSEIGWTGGGPIGFAVLKAGVELGIPDAVVKGRASLDRVAGCTNEASGLLWDVYNPHNGIGPGVDWWWTGYLVKGCHCAYTNGSAVAYLLQGYAWLRKQTGEAPAAWLTTACGVLDTMCKLQEPSGNFGYTYRTDRPEILDPRGYAGVWFVPPLVQAFELTGNQDYLAAAEKAFAYYRGFVRDLCCWGTPMDTKWAPDQEGVLGFIRAAALLHRLTGREEYLVALGEGAEYEYLWRYGFRARPEAPPLKGTGWNSCGASGTSVSNAHLHPMSLIVAGEFAYLAEKTGDTYHRDRLADVVQWALNSIELYPEVMGYGRLGVMSERYCPSDGLLEERYPDGTPASTWFSYNGWGAAAALEGLISIPITEKTP